MKNHYICASSLLFLVPSLLSFYINAHILGYCGIITTIVSMNYWRRVEYGFRRNLDLVCSRIMITIGSGYYLLYYNNTIYDIVLFCFLGKVLSVLYLTSDFKNEYWYVYHMTFHFMLMLSGTLTVYKIYLSQQ